MKNSRKKIGELKELKIVGKSLQPLIKGGTDIINICNGGNGGG